MNTFRVLGLASKRAPLDRLHEILYAAVVNGGLSDV
jgi:hypothetical protein